MKIDKVGFYVCDNHAKAVVTSIDTRQNMAHGYVDEEGERISQSWSTSSGKCPTNSSYDIFNYNSLCDGFPIPPPINDPVNHPQHYTTHPSGIECIQITRHMSFNLGNAFKYIWRADLKNGVEDLEKAVWYLKDEIQKRKKGEGA